MSVYEEDEPTEEMDPETLKAVLAEDKLNQDEAEKWFRRNQAKNGNGKMAKALQSALDEIPLKEISK